MVKPRVILLSDNNHSGNLAIDKLSVTANHFFFSNNLFAFIFIFYYIIFDY